MLSTLIDNNLLRQDEQPDGEPRFTMLETIRAYAQERLEQSEDADALRRRHSEYFVGLAEQIVEQERNAADVDWPAFERELDNFRAALDRVTTAGETETAVRLVTGLSNLWQTTGRLSEGNRWLDWALEAAGDVSPSLRARAMLGASGFAWRRRDFGRARNLAEEALTRFRELDDPTYVAWSLANTAIIVSLDGDFAESDALATQAERMFRELGNVRGAMVQTHNRALTAIEAGDYVRGRQLLEQSLADAERAGSDQFTGNALCDLGVLALYEGRYEDAAPLFARALESALRTGWRINLVYTIRGLAATAAARADLDAAARLLGAADVIEEEIGERPQGYAVRIYADTAAPVLDRLDEPQIAAAHAAGRAMTQADAVAYALTTVSEQAPL
jgi:tetratricopeptide (TPR) repeat protein